MSGVDSNPPEMSSMKTLLALLAIPILLAGEPWHRATLVEGGGYFPVLVKLQNGDLLATIRGGAAHRGRAGRIDTIRSTDGGKSWSAPTVLVDGPEDDRNPALGQLADGTVLAAFTIIKWEEPQTSDTPKPGYQSSNDGLYIMRSTDNGKTWTPPARLPEMDQFRQKLGMRGGSPYGKIFQLPDGTVLMAVYFSVGKEHQQSYLFRSQDGGKTWVDPILLGDQYNETGILVTSEGRILAAMRSVEGRYIAMISSEDNGRTWSPPMRVTNDHEHPADLIELSDGRILMTYGQRNTPRGVEALISSDVGRTWNPETKVKLAEEVKWGDNGYPSSVETEPGTIVTLYYQVDDPDGKQAGARCNLVIWPAGRISAGAESN